MKVLMSYKRLALCAVLAAVAAWPSGSANAGDLKINLPQRSKLTPVQRLNREGVDAVRKHQYDKAKTLFYRAFLFDPDDPFTLNNLGYISELEGNAESAQRFYGLALQQASNAVVDKASAPQAEGKSVHDVLAGGHDFTQSNAANREAIGLLSKGRASEANLVLQQALPASPRNAFTLNNVGVAKEMQGELEEAVKYYTLAANAPQAAEAVALASDRSWRGKPLNELAASNAKKVQLRLQNESGDQAKASRLDFQGVSALNRNDRSGARQYFQQAYALDPNYSFSINNIGYLAELDGDLETAQNFYERARNADHGKSRIGLATRSSAEGMKLSEIAADNNQQAEASIKEKRGIRLREKGPIQLQKRTRPPAKTQQSTPQSDPSNPQ